MEVFRLENICSANPQINSKRKKSGMIFNLNTWKFLRKSYDQTTMVFIA